MWYRGRGTPLQARVRTYMWHPITSTCTHSTEGVATLFCTEGVAHCTHAHQYMVYAIHNPGVVSSNKGPCNLHVLLEGVARTDYGYYRQKGCGTLAEKVCQVLPTTYSILNTNKQRWRSLIWLTKGRGISAQGNKTIMLAPGTSQWPHQAHCQLII